MSVRLVTIDDVRAAERLIRDHVSPAPLIRSYALEQRLGLPAGRRVWLKDYGWTPSGSFKLLGGLNWMANNLERIGNRPVAAHSSGNFASGIAFAGMRFGKRRDRRHARIRTAGQVRAHAVVRCGDPHLRHRPRSSDRRTRSVDAGDRRRGRGHPGVSRTTTPMSSRATASAPSRSSATCCARGAGSRSSSVRSAAAG